MGIIKSQVWPDCYTDKEQQPTSSVVFQSSPPELLLGPVELPDFAAQLQAWISNHQGQHWIAFQAVDYIINTIL